MNLIKNETKNYISSNNKGKIKDELVYLINTLNTVIKSFYSITKQIIFKSKEDMKNKNNLEYINNIEKQLSIFIQNAKEIFNKMKYVQKRNLLNQEKNNGNQLYNYCNNNFFYYSQTPILTNTQYTNKPPDENLYRRITYKSPKINSNINIDYFNNLNRNNQKIKSPRYIQINKEKIINKNKSDFINETYTNTNYSSSLINKKNILPPKKLNLKNIVNKDELLKKILSLLKQLKLFKGKIFYETNEAQKCKNIFYIILQELNKLIEILSEEKNKEYKCLSARNYQETEKYNNLLNSKKDLVINPLTTKRKKLSTNLPNSINKTFNTRNVDNELKKQLKASKSQNINLKFGSKSIDERSKILISKNNKHKEEENNNNNIENKNIIKKKSYEISLRNILYKDCQKNMSQKSFEDKRQEEKDKEKEKEKEKKEENENVNNKKFIDTDQQTDNIYKNIISKEKEFFIENNYNFKVIEKEKIIKDLESKIQIMKNNIISLKGDLTNSNNQLSFFKVDNDKQGKQINDMSKEIILLKKLLENKDKEDILIKNKKDKKEKNNKKDNKEKEEKNIINQYEELETDRDKISIKYELLKLDYDKQKLNLKEKEKMLNNYNLYNITNESKNIDDQIFKLINKHKKEIDELKEKYIKDIINLKVNLPNSFSPTTHEILIDKTFKEYDLHWYLLTVIPAKKKDYENTFWVSQNEIKDSLEKFNKFKNEEEIEKENMADYFIAQQKLIKRIENNEDNITKLEVELKKYKNNE